MLLGNLPSAINTPTPWTVNIIKYSLISLAIINILIFDQYSLILTPEGGHKEEPPLFLSDELTVFCFAG